MSNDSLNGHHETVGGLIEAWDKGDSVWSIDLGGMGPGYEQAIQVAAVEMARACKDLSDIKQNDKESTKRFRAKCDERLHEIDGDLGGLSGAQAGAAQWLAFQWCFNGGPAALQKRLKEDGKGSRAIQISKMWPKVASKQTAQSV
jgi:hypothetical protein